VDYYISRDVRLSYERAVERVTEELKKEGFGILTEIDVKATLKKKLDLDFRPYVILGACNPPLAHHALSIEDKIGTLLPCNVIVQQHPDGRVELAAMDPGVMAEVTGNAELAELAREARERITRALNAV